jgi:hypothetical protein
MLELSDFYDDQLLLRQVKRAQRRNEVDMEDDEDAAESRRRDAQVEEVDDEGESILLPEKRRSSVKNMKREPKSRGPSMAPSQPGEPLSGNKEEEEEEDDAGDTPSSGA